MIPILRTRRTRRGESESCRDYVGPMTCPVPVGKSQDRRRDQGNEASVLTELTFQGVYKEPPSEQNGMRNKEGSRETREQSVCGS